MRPQLTGLMLAFGVIGMGDLSLAPAYVPGQIRDGFYIRPHFVSAPRPRYGPWPGRAGERDQAPLLVPAPAGRGELGQPS